jgi:hypothetical protein
MLNQLKYKIRQGAVYSTRCVAAGLRSPTGRALQQVALLMVVMWLVSETTDIAFAQGPNPPPAGGSMRAGLVQLVTMAIDGLVFAGGLILALGVAGNFVSGQIATAIGNPSGLSHTYMRMIGIIVSFLGLMLTIPIVNTIITVVMANIQMGTLTTAGLK